MSNEEWIARYKNQLEGYLREFYEKRSSLPQSRLFEAMQYSLMAGGKRLRPVLAMEFCRLCGGDWHQAVPFAAAVEMIHTYSLIHDDLPAMDNDDFRRGEPTNHRVYGEAMAILAGDALLTDAFMVAATAQLPDPKDMAFAIETLAECAGSMGMVGGQALDIASGERELTEQEVIDIQTRKTGALIHAACVLGAIAGGGSEEQMRVWEWHSRFGMICWMLSEPSRSWVRESVRMKPRTPLFACMVWKPVRSWFSGIPAMLWMPWRSIRIPNSFPNWPEA